MGFWEYRYILYMRLRKTHIQFIEKANIKHNNKYNYPETYAGDAVKINIKCPIHGIFSQIPSSHLQGCGCPKCANELCAKLFTTGYDKFIEKSAIIHNNKYKYPGEYKSSRTKIDIECSIHGIFKQTPDKHLQGNGCPKCAGTIRKTKEEFVAEAVIVHNGKYSYPGAYINARTDIIIECPKHGVFPQVPDAHLNGVGCPTCSSNSSKSEMKWLDSLGIPNDNVHRHCRIYIGDTYIKPDGFDPNTNTIYEFYGDYFHGNPNVYDLKMINHKNGKTLEELYRKTLEREKLIVQAGYKIISIWEYDWNMRSNQ